MKKLTIDETIERYEKYLSLDITTVEPWIARSMMGTLNDLRTEIDFYFQPIIDTSYLFDIRYRAEYYDGYCAPYPILFWNGPIEELLNIVKTKIPDFQIDKGEYEIDEK